MTAGHIKGALLEHFVRELLKNCGFTNVVADGLYTFESKGLFFVNGKGAAHDADVFMNPPVQMPFSYPTQLMFECKAYGKTANLPIVRNALGLRNDINEFEIVTIESIQQRKNDRRSEYAIEARNRYIIQVGVASINEFSKPAIEFATNNKIPLLSLSWFFDTSTIEKINGIDDVYIRNFTREEIANLYAFLKDRNGNIYDDKYELTHNIIRLRDGTIKDIFSFAITAIRHAYLGLLETGDMVFLIPSSRGENILSDYQGTPLLKARFHFYRNRPDVWYLRVFNEAEINSNSEYKFFMPDRLFSHWKKFNLDLKKALDIKADFFSKLFVFNRANNPIMPFSIVTIDNIWLNEARDSINR
jgi:hypothetical protein